MARLILLALLPPLFLGSAAVSALAQAASRVRSDTIRADSAKRAKRPVKRKPPLATTRPAAPPPEWPVKTDPPLPGSILPASRIVAFYGNPLSKRMGILGAIP